MAISSNLKHFPIVKVVPLHMLDVEKDQLGGSTLSAMVGNALVSLDDMRALWRLDHDAAGLKEKFDKLYYQLDSLHKYCENGNKFTE